MMRFGRFKILLSVVFLCILIIPCMAGPIDADFEATPTSGHSPLTVTFIDKSIIPSGYQIVYQEWLFYLVREGSWGYCPDGQPIRTSVNPIQFTFVVPDPTVTCSYDVYYQLGANGDDGSYGWYNYEYKEDFIHVQGSSPHDLWISEVKPVQVVWDSDINDDGKIDIVLEKPTAYFINVSDSNLVGLDDKGLINVSFSVEGTTHKANNTVENIKQGKSIITPNIIFHQKGDQSITFLVDPDNAIDEFDETNNTYSQTVTVKAVNDTFIGYFPITNPKSPYSAKISPIVMSNYRLTAKNNNKFINATFPLGVNDFHSSISDKQIPADWPAIETLDNLNDSIIKDLTKVKILGEKMKQPYPLQFYAGIVPTDYFAAHNRIGETGAMVPTIEKTSLGITGRYTTIAHEIAHNLGLHTDRDEYDKVTHVLPSGYMIGGDAANGYDVTDLYNRGTANRFIWFGKSNGNPFTENGICVMGADGDGTYTYNWSNNLANPPEILPKWICRQDYIDLFKNMSENKNDPELLLVSGTFSEDGTFSLDNTYWIDSGFPDELESGDYSVVLFDKDHQMIAETSFSDPYVAIFEPSGRVKMNTGVIVFTIPYPKEVATIQLTHNDEVIGEFNPHEQLLDDAISTLPDSAFGIDPTQQRTELQTDISEINTLIEQNNILGARIKLEQEKVKLQDWLIDGYQTENPLQLTKTEVIALIDNILSRLAVIAPANNSPDLQNPGDQTIAIGKTLTLNLVATDPDSDPLIYTFTPTLAGASITGNTFTWTPLTGSAGKYSVTFNVTDTGSLSDEEKINITVTAPTTNVPTTVKIVPKTINLGSKGYFLAFATLPEAYKGATIDMKTVTCSGATAVRMVRPKIFPRIAIFVFKTSDLIDVPLGTKVPLTLNGEMKNTGKSYTFTGSDTIKVISKPTWQPDDIKDISKESDDQLFKKFNM